MALSLLLHSMVNISQLIRFARAFSQVSDFNSEVYL